MALGLVLAGCAGGAPAATEPQQAPPPIEALPASPTLPPPADTAAPEPTAVEPSQPEAPDLGPIPEGDPQLHATNPSTVNLSAGQPTLVEFFAFW